MIEFCSEAHARAVWMELDEWLENIDRGQAQRV